MCCRSHSLLKYYFLTWFGNIFLSKIQLSKYTKYIDDSYLWKDLVFRQKKTEQPPRVLPFLSSFFPVARFHHLLIQKKGCQGHAALSLLFQKFWGQPKKSPYHVKSTRTHKKGWLPKFRRLFSSHKKTSLFLQQQKQIPSQKHEIVILF